MPRTVDYPATIERLETEAYGTQKALAESMNVSPRTVQRWKSGEINVSGKTREKLYRRARHYGVREYEDDQEPPPPPDPDFYRTHISSEMQSGKDDIEMELIAWKESKHLIDFEEVRDHYMTCREIVKEQFGPAVVSELEITSRADNDERWGKPERSFDELYGVCVVDTHGNSYEYEIDTEKRALTEYAYA